ncbi:hypothetical protein NEFER02_2239, partial [Nematocida sp. LUAm2]
YEVHIRGAYTRCIYEVHIRGAYTRCIYEVHIRGAYTRCIYEVHACHCTTAGATTHWVYARHYRCSQKVRSLATHTSMYIKHIYEPPARKTTTDPAAGSPTATLLRLTSYLAAETRSLHPSSLQPSEIVTGGVYKLQGHIHCGLLSRSY